MKRKITEQAAAAPPKKRSPLLGRPQNQYEAPDPHLSKAELSEWRKQQRKERNRASAAASRMKTQTRIMELEGEVNLWKAKYEDMQDKMMKLQRQVDLLTKVHCHPTDYDSAAKHDNYSMVSPTSSHLNSPTSSLEHIDALSLLQGLSRPQEVVSSSDASSLFPPQSSSPEDQAMVESEVMSNVDDSKKHLNKISRQA